MMTVREVHSEIQNFDVEQLQQLIKLAHIELVDRFEKQQNELKENFFKAFNALKENNIALSYTNDDQEEIRLEYKENFNFKPFYTNDDEEEELYFEN